jgi:hypothetical protein
MNASDLKSTGLSVLTCEVVETDEPCSKCHEDSGGRLLQYATRVGNRVRIHPGLFCSKGCHDRFFGLVP